MNKRKKTVMKVILSLFAILLIIAIIKNSSSTFIPPDDKSTRKKDLGNVSNKNFYTDLVGKTESFLISNWGEPDFYDTDKIIPSAIYLDRPHQIDGNSGFEKFNKGLEKTSWYEFIFDTNRRVFVVVRKRAFLSLDKADKGRDELIRELNNSTKYFVNGESITYQGESYGAVKLLPNQYAPGYIVQIAVSNYSLEEIRRIGSGEKELNF